MGSKAQAVKNILNNVPAKCLKLIVDYTVEVGYENTPWSDDCLGSKKWLTGFQHFVQIKNHFLCLYVNSRKRTQSMCTNNQTVAGKYFWRLLVSFL